MGAIRPWEVLGCLCVVAVIVLAAVLVIVVVRNKKSEGPPPPGSPGWKGPDKPQPPYRGNDWMGGGGPTP